MSWPRLLDPALWASPWGTLRSWFSPLLGTVHASPVLATSPTSRLVAERAVGGSLCAMRAVSGSVVAARAVGGSLEAER